jgi:hypothetical protein
MEVTSQPVALLHHAQLAAPLEQPRIYDSDRSVRGQHLDHVLIRIRKGVLALLVREIESGNDLTSRNDGHPQE